MASSADWSSLPSDLVNRIAGCLLATNDVDYYMDFRAVCSTWRSATTDTKNNPDKRFHPSRWVVIDEVSSVDVEDRTRLLVNTATGRVLRKDLPMLRKYYIIVTTGGFFVLADKKPPHATCVLNPFTGYLLRFMAPMVTEKVAAAAVAGPTLILFCDSCRTMYTANVCSACFDACRNQYYPYKKLGLILGVLYTGHDVRNKMFNLMGSFAVHPTEMLTIYPFEDVVDDYGARNTERCFLVESAGQMLMIFKLQERMEVFKVDNDISTPQPVKSIGNRAIFLGYRQCLSVNADKFQMVEANCIYYVKCRGQESFSHFDIYKYDLKDEKEEMISGAIDTLSNVFLFDAEPPFTIIQLLSSYTFNSWGSELESAKNFERLPNFIPNAKDFGLSSYLEDLEFGD